MTVFTAKAVASSRHPSDWGRAVAAALDCLVAQSQQGEDGLETAELFGADITLHIEQADAGAELTLTWTTDQAQGQ